MAEFDALFFDMDGTLVENSSLMPKAFRKAFADAGFMIDIDNKADGPLETTDTIPV